MDMFERQLEEENPKGELKRGEASLIQPIPLPLDKGKGIKGKGSPYKNLRG